MSMTGSLALIKNDSPMALESFVEELRSEIGEMNIMMAITPVTQEDRSENPHDRNRAKSKMLRFEEKLIELLPVLWGAANQIKSKITEKYWVRPTNRKQVLQTLMGNPIKSFAKTRLNNRAWIKNSVYRTNVNFEGYAHWNAAIFYWVAKRISKMSEDDINLVLRVIPFNETVAYRSIFAPLSLSNKGTGNHSSLLSPERYREFLITFCHELSSAIVCHRQGTERRYSAREVTGNSVDPHTQEIVQQIRHIYNKHRKAAERVVLKQKKGV